MQHSATVAFEIPGPPLAFARTRHSKLGALFTPKPQRDYGALIKLRAAGIMAGTAPTEAPVSVSIRAIYLAPSSWSRKKRDAARWKTSKPDIDNIVKIAKDAMTGIVYRDDAQVVDLAAQKVYGPLERLVIEVSPA